jgi:hypothetical protein
LNQKKKVTISISHVHKCEIKRMKVVPFWTHFIHFCKETKQNVGNLYTKLIGCAHDKPSLIWKVVRFLKKPKVGKRLLDDTAVWCSGAAQAHQFRQRAIRSSRCRQIDSLARV